MKIFTAARVVLISCFVCASAAPLGAAEEYACEALRVTGPVMLETASGETRALRDGDLLAAGDSLASGAGASATIGYDADWQNVLSVGPSTRVTLKSVHPSQTKLEGGEVYALLKKLPKGSSFEVVTPTAVAVVRGSEYRTRFEAGRTEVFNHADSPVAVFGVGEDGARQGAPVELRSSEGTEVVQAGSPPAAPAPLDPAESAAGAAWRGRADQEIGQASQSGRLARIQSVQAVEARLQSSSEAATVETRVVDRRRRSFKTTENVS